MMRRVFESVRALPRRSLAVTFGLLIVMAFAAAMPALPAVWPHGPEAVDSQRMLSSPSLRHPLGTDGTGRDVFARVVDGTRYAFAIPLAAVLLGISLGAPVGLLAGLFGGIADRLLRALFLAIGFFPPLLLALALVAAMGPSLRHLVVGLGVVEAIFFARAMREQIRALHVSGFIEGAVAMGNSVPRMVLMHLLPNTLAGTARELPRRAAWALGTLAVMGFIGIGSAADVNEWGAMVRDGVERMYTGQWWLAIFPGLALLTLGFGLQLLATGFADLDRRNPAILAGASAEVPR